MSDVAKFREMFEKIGEVATVVGTNQLDLYNVDDQLSLFKLCRECAGQKVRVKGEDAMSRPFIWQRVGTEEFISVLWLKDYDDGTFEVRKIASDQVS